MIQVKGAIAAAMLMLVLIPGVTANHPEAGDYTYGTIEYHLTANGTTNQNIATTTQLMSLTFTDSPRNDFNISSHLLIFHLANTGIYRADSTGQWQITTTLDDVPLDDCSYIIRTFNSGVLGGDLPVVPHHTPACTVNDLGDGVNGGIHVLNITATIIQGTPADLENYNTHVTIRRQDTYMIPQDQNEILATATALFPLLATIGFLIWAERKDMLIAYFAALASAVTAVITMYEDFGLFGITAGVMFTVLIIGRAMLSAAKDETDEDGEENHV